MGYTHYWNSAGPIDPDKYSAALSDIEKLIKASKVKLADGGGDKGTKPEITPEYISFNGVESDAHETCFFPRDPSKLDSDFCKTAFKPYDAIVTACLTRLAEVPGIQVLSDGEPSDWKDGLSHYLKVLKRTPSIPGGVQ